MDDLPKEFHEFDCQLQPEGFPCRCDEIKEQKQKVWDEILENEEMGN